jgi:hypothetical protein
MPYPKKPRCPTRTQLLYSIRNESGYLFDRVTQFDSTKSQAKSFITLIIPLYRMQQREHYQGIPYCHFFGSGKKRETEDEKE